MELDDCRALLDTAYRDWGRSREAYLHTLGYASADEVAAMVDRADRALRDFAATLEQIPQQVAGPTAITPSELPRVFEYAIGRVLPV